MENIVNRFQFRKKMIFARSIVGVDSDVDIIYIHGLGGDSDEIFSLLSDIEDQGMNVHSLDLEGFGRSQGPRADIDSFSSYIRLLDEFIDLIRKKYGSRDIVLAGASMGAMIALMYQLQERNDRVAGIIALSVPLSLKIPKGLYKGLFWMMSHIYPNWKLRYHIGGAADDDKVELSIRLAYEISRAVDYIRQNLSTLETPVLFLQGENDDLADIKRVRAIFDHIVSKNKGLKTYDTDHLFSGKARETAITDALSWAAGIGSGAA